MDLTKILFILLKYKFPYYEANSIEKAGKPEMVNNIDFACCHI